MSQLHYLEKWFVYRCHLNMYTVSQSMHSSEQNLIGILCLTLVMLFQDFVHLCWSCRGISLTLEYKCAQQAECPCACVTCQLHSQIVIIIMLLVLKSVFLVIVISLPGGWSFYTLVSGIARHQYARPHPMDRYNYYITCYLGNITAEERYEQHSYMLPR